MKIKLTLQIDDSEVTRNYTLDTVEEKNWQKEVESMTDSMIEESAVNNLESLNEKEKMALGY